MGVWVKSVLKNRGRRKSTDRNRLNLNNSGTSLVSVMVAVAAMAGLVVLGNKTIIHGSEMSATADSRQNLVSVFENLRLMAQGPELCSSVLKAGSTVITLNGATDIPSLTIGSEVYKPETKGNLTIDSIQLVDEAALPNSHDKNGVDRGHRRVRLEMKGSLAGSKAYQFTKTFRMDVLVDGGNQVVDCYQGQENPKVACETLGGTYKYTPTPSCDMSNRFGLQSVTCPVNKCVVGFDVNNVPVCGDI